MPGRHHAERGAEDRVQAGRENLERFLSGTVLRVQDRKAHDRTGAPADPVALHGAHALRPAAHAVELSVQLLRVGGDLQKPLVELGAPDDRFAAPAPPRLHLLVRQDGLARSAPVHPAPALVGQAALQHLEKEPLVPAVVVRTVDGDLAAPVVRQAQPAELPAHVDDVLVGPAGRVGAVLDGGVLGRQAERVPAHGMEDFAATHALEAGHGVADRVVPHVAHVQPPGGVRQHFQAVKLRAPGSLPRLESTLLAPALLPFALEGVELIAILSLHRRMSPGRLQDGRTF